MAWICALFSPALWYCQYAASKASWESSWPQAEPQTELFCCQGAENRPSLPLPPVPQFAKALGIDLDLTDKGLGVRSRRYAMLVEDQVVKVRPVWHMESQSRERLMTARALRIHTGYQPGGRRWLLKLHKKQCRRNACSPGGLRAMVYVSREVFCFVPLFRQAYGGP